MTKQRILIAVIAIAALGFGAYTFVLPKPVVKEKVAGTVYVLPKQFTLNLKDGHYATLTAALVLAPGQSTGASAEAAPSSDGFGTLPEEPVIRDIITGVVTNRTAASLIGTGGRARLKHEVLDEILKQTDVKVTSVLFTDVAVQ